jgi:NadR type nicotinamide-nucleotide adenylyltransferase
VVLFGTESTGKSTLAEGLATHFGEPWAREFVREYWDRRGGVIEAQDLTVIARGQIANIEVAALGAKRVLFCDTDLLMNVRWADELFPGNCPAWLRRAADERARSNTLYLCGEPDVDWEDDPQRSFRDRAAWLASAERCQAMLVERGLPWVRVAGKGEARLQMAIDAVTKILG